MPTLRIKADGKGDITLNDGNFLAQGGEGSVYKKDNIAYKIYHDGKKCIPEDKIKELSVFTNQNILGPKGIVRDLKSLNPIGFWMPFVPGTLGICKLFTLSYRNQVSFTEKNTVELVSEIQKVLKEIHNKKCLVVDLNEFALLVNDKHKTPYFIDVDSWQTPSHKATALMDSVRDRKIVNNNFTEYSDWFSWGIVCVQLYLGVHPYKGKHPDYLPKDWQKRMDDGVSIFDAKASLPPSCRDFSVIPKRHLEWFKDVYKNGNRTVPPMADDTIPVPTVATLIVVKGTENFEATRVGKYTENVVFTYSLGSENYAITTSHLYIKSYGTTPIRRDLGKYPKKFVFNSLLGEAFIALFSNNELSIEKTELKHEEKSEITKFSCDDIFFKDGNLYHIIDDKILKDIFVKGNKVMHTTKLVGSINPSSCKVFDGVVYQNLLGAHAFVVPFDNDCVFFNVIKEMNGYRVVDAKAEENFLVVLAEKGGFYTRFVVIIQPDYKTYTVRTSDNVDLEEINFTKIPDKVCVLYVGDETVEIFKDNSKIKEVDKCPLDASMSLFNSNGKVFFTNKNEVYKLDIK